MARILFLHEIPYEFVGVMSLASYAKAAGHEVELLVYSVEGKKFWKKVEEFRPDVIGFSTMIFVHFRTLPFAQEVKKRLGVPIIIGGPYPTYEPERVIDKPFVDAIVRGEGEEALVDMLNALDEGKSWKDIPNVWTKENGEIIRNAVRPLPQEMDKFPIGDRSIYYKYRYLRDITTKTFITGRGCPFDCHFCWIQEFHKLYGGKSKPVRRFSPDYMIEEIAQVVDKYPLKRIYFNDDIFIINKKWLQEFLPKYKERIGIPFVCNVYLRLVDEDVVKLLKENGCAAVMFGIESGNERIRNEVLGKGLTEDQIYDGVALLKKYNIRTRSFNIIGSPTETIENAFETIKMNARIKVDLPWCSIYQPHPGTTATQIAIESGALPADFDVDRDMKGLSLFKNSCLQQPDIKKLVRTQKLFNIGVRQPWTIPILRKMVNWPLDSLYELLFLATFSARYMRETDMSLKQVMHTGFLQIREYWNKPFKPKA
ncbi:hypothetical protein CEE37_06695 [candidate division LCP-89 bacterium B3_LCP]|uniref:Uncharacterized protein n=1 Tax=candidate division LCP-89 bacterium B3_LCP TaxID=2012998 RepID=A0A532V0A7_UNCL8|nr:MAG: hypothetical protein CEE37_06695 [candidate division LCP-89 bacterium B3_LCP]